MPYAICNQLTGKIRCITEGQINDCGDNEIEIEIIGHGYTHIIDGVPTILEQPPPVLSPEISLALIRREIAQRLSASDWTQLPDSPFSVSQKQAWVAYRQALRDFPETCDVNNPVWPVAPI